jgi:hypothetical protein
MSFQTPGFSPGPSPDDWAELEARRIERTQRAHNPYGRDMGAGMRRALQLGFIGFAAVIVVLTVLGLIGVIQVPGFDRIVGR